MELNDDTKRKTTDKSNCFLSASVTEQTKEKEKHSLRDKQAICGIHQSDEGAKQFSAIYCERCPCREEKINGGE